MTMPGETPSRYCTECRRQKRVCCCPEPEIVAASQMSAPPSVHSSALVAEGRAPLQKHLDEWTTRVSKTVALLREWQALEYTGHFIDLHPEMIRLSHPPSL